MAVVGNSPAVQLALRPSNNKLMDALSTAAAQVESGQADAAIRRWFGDDAIPQRKELAMTIRRFRSNINVKTITVGFEAVHVNPNPDYQKVVNPDTGKVSVKSPKVLRTKGTNAAAFASQDSNVSMSLGDLLSHSPKGEAPVELGEGFSKLPLWLPMAGGQIDASGWIQSQFETLVHELSHLLLGTEDVKFTDGTTAYGTQSAAELATFGSAHAFRNAENWGIFIEAAGVHKTA